MRSVAEHPKRVGSSVELMQVHSHTDDDIDGSDIPIEDDSDDSEDLEERIAAAHHRFEDDIDNVSLLTTASLASSPERAESGMALSRGASRSLAVSQLFFFLRSPHSPS